MYTLLFHRTQASEPVCFVGIGNAGRRLVFDLRAQAHPPLAELLRTMPRKPAKSFPFNDLHPDGIVILFIAFAVDASAAEIEAARHLLWRAYAQETYVIGILIHPQDDAGGIRAPQLDVVIEALDARIDVRGGPASDAPQSLGWFVAALRKLSLEGVLILEPAWDLQDVAEVLDLPGAQLSLSSIQVAKGAPLGPAVELALQGLVEGGIDLEQVSGVMLVLWQAPLEGLTVSQAREANQALRQILGPGSLHLTLRLRTRADWSGVAVSMTLVVSVRGGRLPSATECR